MDLVLEHRYTPWIVLLVVLIFLNTYALSALTTRPPLWYDEGLNIEMARNFAEVGKLDIAISPGVYAGGAIIGSTGYPTTLPLAGFFKLFGTSLTVARIYMLLWMNLLILSAFVIFKSKWGAGKTLSLLLLLVTFAPLYGNGNTVMGEIPGFVLLLWAYYFLEKRNYFTSGVLLGFSVVGKPSMYLFAIPAFVLIVMLEEGSFRERIKNLFKLGLTSTVALFMWCLIYLRELIDGTAIRDIALHFQNPYQGAGISVSENFLHNISSFFHSTTLIYFLLICLFITGITLRHRHIFTEERKLFILSSTFLMFSFLQYLKSLGYLRYLLAAQLLVFIVLTVSLYRFFATTPDQSFFRKYPLAPIMLGVLTILQAVHLLSFSDIGRSSTSSDAVHYIEETYPDATVGLINVPTVGSLIPSNRKYQFLETYGLPRFGVNPLTLPTSELPTVVVMDTRSRYLIATEEDVLEQYYSLDKELGSGLILYHKK